ncbi:MAG: hypothetical protein AAGG75_03145 [Bacteroidota bacterium]
MAKTTQKIPTPGDASAELDKAFDCMDEYRAKGLESVNSVQNVKLNMRDREQKRLLRKYGKEHPRTLKVQGQVNYAKSAKVSLAEEARKAKVEVARFNDSSWRVRGRVVDKDLKGQSGLTVSLFDNKGNWIKELGQVCTDDEGTFVLTYVEKDGGEIAKRFAGQALTLTVSDKDQQVLHQEEEPVALELGSITSRLIILGNDQCTSPPDTTDPKDDPDKPVDDPGTPTTGQQTNWTIIGAVSNLKTGKGQPGLKVMLIDETKDFSNYLFDTETLRTGKFEMIYSFEEFKPLFENRPPLFLEVLNVNGEIIYRSEKPIFPEAGKTETFNIQLG